MQNGNNNRIVWDKEAETKNDPTLDVKGESGEQSSPPPEPFEQFPINGNGNGAPESEIINPGFGKEVSQAKENIFVDDAPTPPFSHTIIPDGEKEVPQEHLTPTQELEEMPGFTGGASKEIWAEQAAKEDDNIRTFDEDFEKVIHSKEGGVVSQIIEEARAEEAEEEAKSPRSLKNIIFISLSILLGALAIILVYLVFVQGDPRLIEDKTVSSLVYADSHVGIDVTGLTPSKAKSLVDRVVNKPMPAGMIKHIYYVEEEMDVFRRLGLVPTLGVVGEEIEDERVILEDMFMHGVHSTNGENPFIIARVNSYEGAYDLLRDWEGDMVGDLAAFMDFPDEVENRRAGDEFADEIIENIPARVLRYTPTGETAGLWERITSWFSSLIDFQTPITTAFAQTEPDPRNPNNLNFDFNVYEDENVKDEVKTLCVFNGPRIVTDDEGNDIVIIQGDLPSITTRDYLLATFPDDIDLYTCMPALGDILEKDEGNICTLTNINYEDYPVTGAKIKEMVDKGYSTIHQSVYEELKSEYQSLYSCISTFDPKIDLSISQNSKEDDICIVTYVPTINDPQYEIVQRLKSDPRLRMVYRYEWESIDDDYKQFYSCVSSVGDAKTDLQEQKLLFQKGIPVVCFDKKTGLRMSTSVGNTFCLNPVICVTNDGRYSSEIGATEDSCFVSINILSLEKIDTFACWTNVLSLVDIIFGRDSGDRCFDMFSSTGGQFYSDYSIDNLRNVLRQLASLMQGGQSLARLLMLDRLIGDEIMQEMEDISTFMIRVSHIDVFRIDMLRDIAGYIQRVERIILTLERIGFPQNSFMDEVKMVIGYVREFLGLKHNVGWITLDGYINVDRYSDENTFLSLGDSDFDVDVIKQSLFNLGILAEDALNVAGLNLDDAIIADMLETNGVISSAPGTLDEKTRGALIVFQDLNNLSSDGVVDTKTIQFLTQIIRAGGTITGSEYTLDLFADWTAAEFLQSGGVLVGLDGEVIDGSDLSDDNIGYYDSITVAEFINEGGKIQPITSDSGENLSIVTNKLWRELRRGHYGHDVATAQITMRVDGINVGALNGIYDSYTEEDVREFQRKHGLPETGIIDDATRAKMNGLIDEHNLVGSGYYLDADGFLQGYGTIEGIEQPGLDILPTEASDTLRPGDIILLYLFLDEETVLFVRNPETVREIIRRQANSQISPQ